MLWIPREGKIKGFLWGLQILDCRIVWGWKIWQIFISGTFWVVIFFALIRSFPSLEIQINPFPQVKPF